MGNFRGTEVGLSRATSGFRKGFEFVSDEIDKAQFREDRRMDLEDKRDVRKNLKEFKAWMENPATASMDFQQVDNTTGAPVEGSTAQGVNLTGNAPFVPAEGYGKLPEVDPAQFVKDVGKWRDKFTGAKGVPEDMVDQSLKSKQIGGLQAALNSMEGAINSGDWSAVEEGLKQADAYNPSGATAELHKGSDGKLYTKGGIEITADALTSRMNIIRDPNAEREYQDKRADEAQKQENWQKEFDQMADRNAASAKYQQDLVDQAAAALGFEKKKYDEFAPHERNKIQSEILVNYGKFANDRAKAAGGSNRMTPSQTMTYGNNVNKQMEVAMANRTDKDGKEFFSDGIMSQQLEMYANDMGIINGAGVSAATAVGITERLLRDANGVPDGYPEEQALNVSVHPNGTYSVVVNGDHVQLPSDLGRMFDERLQAAAAAGEGSPRDPASQNSYSEGVAGPETKDLSWVDKLMIDDGSNVYPGSSVGVPKPISDLAIGAKKALELAKKDPAFHGYHPSSKAVRQRNETN